MLSSLEHHKQRILVVDDEASIRRILETRLSMTGYDVVTAANGRAALEIFHHQVLDLVILDVMMPELDGYGVCQALREETDIPIIMLTGLADVADRITGLQLGADDYMVKPFSPKELISRIRCILRRAERLNISNISTSKVIQTGFLRIDTNKRQVYKDNQRIPLTYMEFSLLELLVSRPGEAISRPEIVEKVWGYIPERSADTRVVDVHVSRLRDKLQEDSSQPEFILTVRGIGYAFQDVE